jgi:hypothetical protein
LIQFLKSLRNLGSLWTYKAHFHTYIYKKINDCDMQDWVWLFQWNSKFCWLQHIFNFYLTCGSDAFSFSFNSE